MGSQLTTLTSADIRRFERDGYLVVRQAFAPADGLAMERQWWRELEDTHGIRRDDRSGWRQLPGDLKAAKRDPRQAKILTGRVRGALDDLLGQAAWTPPRDWGRPLVTFPEPGDWEVPARHWHWDNSCEPHLDRPRGLFVVSFIGSVALRGGGTLILSGSPRLLIQQQRQIPPSQRHGSITALRERFHRSHPWLTARTDGRARRHGPLSSLHGPLRGSEPGHVAALHADQDADPHPRGSRANRQLGTSARVAARPEPGR
jgi:hypothetical protein